MANDGFKPKKNLRAICHQKDELGCLVQSDRVHHDDPRRVPKKKLFQGDGCIVQRPNRSLRILKIFCHTEGNKEVSCRAVLFLDLVATVSIAGGQIKIYFVLRPRSLV